MSRDPDRRCNMDDRRTDPHVDRRAGEGATERGGEGAREVARVDEIIAAGKATFVDGAEKIEWETCGICHRKWNIHRISALTPPPSGRCPYEYAHQYDGPIAHRDANVELGGIETTANEHPRKPTYSTKDIPAAKVRARAVGGSDDMPDVKCPECGHNRANFEVVGTVYQDESGVYKTSPAWTVYDDDYAFCANAECEHGGTMRDFILLGAVTFHDDGSSHRMTMEKAMDEMAGAMEDDYANKRWGHIEDDDGNEVPVYISVRVAPPIPD